MLKILSPNMLKTFELCPKKFYFRYVKNINMPVNDEIFELGKNIHAIASYYLKKENIDKMEKSLSIKELELWNYLKANQYFSYSAINTEFNLSVKLGEYFFGGRLDALVRENDHYYILDYKTGNAPPNAQYDFQTMIYILAVKEFFKTNKISFIYIDLKNKTEVKIDITENLANEYQEKLIQIAQKIQLSDFARKKDNCKCEYEIICY